MKSPLWNRVEASNIELFQHKSIKSRQIVDVEFEIHSNKESAKRSEINMENVGNVENIGVEGFDNFYQWLILGLTGLIFLITFKASRQITNEYGIDAGFQVIEIGIQIYLIGVVTLFLIFKILRIIVL